MTFSIVARSGDGELFGVAVASRFLAVGAVVPAAEAGVGAVATQAYANTAYGRQAVSLMRTGASASDAVAGLVAADPLRRQRQVGVVAAWGDGALYTGEGCPDWAGGRTGPGFAIQGNVLAGPHVVDRMSRRWQYGESLPFVQRLLETLRAGDEAGGDRRGRQSAALYVVGVGRGYLGTGDVVVDLRVDDHEAPVEELERLAGLHRVHFEPPVAEDALPLVGEVADEVRGLLGRLGYTGEEETPVEEVMLDWAGMANLEMRMLPGRIDPVVLERLRLEVDGA